MCSKLVQPDTVGSLSAYLKCDHIKCKIRKEFHILGPIKQETFEEISVEKVEIEGLRFSSHKFILHNAVLHHRVVDAFCE